jgi:hypothetical protein
MNCDSQRRVLAACRLWSRGYCRTRTIDPFLSFMTGNFEVVRNTERDRQANAVNQYSFPLFCRDQTLGSSCRAVRSSLFACLKSFLAAYADDRNRNARTSFGLSGTSLVIWAHLRRCWVHRTEHGENAKGERHTLEVSRGTFFHVSMFFRLWH